MEIIMLVKPDLSNLPETPCVGVCNTLYVDNCQGCGRTLMEDANWSVMTSDEKREVWARILKQGWKPNTGIAR